MPEICQRGSISSGYRPGRRKVGGRSSNGKMQDVKCNLFCILDFEFITGNWKLLTADY
jgi:hypothetical protein